MKKLSIAIVLFILVAVNLTAQEKLTPEEMFRWFPEGKYEGASYKNYFAAKTQPGFVKILSVESGSSMHEGVLLPETLKDRWDHMVEMNSVKIVVSIKEDVPEIGRAHRFSQNTVGDKCYVTNHFGYKMQVIRFPPELNLKKLALSQKGVKTSEYTFLGSTVYFDDSEKKSVWSKEAYYFCITPENEFLSCVNPKLLKKMIQAGAGEIPCVIDDFPFPYLLDLLPELNHYWVVNDCSARINALRLKLEKDEVDPAVIEKVFSNKNYYAHSLSDFSFDKNPTTISFKVFDDADTARSVYQKIKSSQKKRSASYYKRFESQLYRDKNTKLSLRDNLVYRTLVFTDEFIEKYSTTRDADRKAYAAERAEKAKQKALEAEENGEIPESEDK